MSAPSVRAQGPPDQDAPPVIHSWGNEHDRLRIEATGQDTALLVRIIDGERTEYGTVTRDGQTYSIKWNGSGLLAYPMRQRDHLDDEIYDRMDRWDSRKWLEYQQAMTTRMLAREEP